MGMYLPAQILGHFLSCQWQCQGKRACNRPPSESLERPLDIFADALEARQERPSGSRSFETSPSGEMLLHVLLPSKSETDRKAETSEQTDAATDRTKYGVAGRLLEGWPASQGHTARGLQQFVVVKASPSPKPATVVVKKESPSPKPAAVVVKKESPSPKPPAVVVKQVANLNPSDFTHHHSNHLFTSYRRTQSLLQSKARMVNRLSCFRTAPIFSGPRVMCCCGWTAWQVVVASPKKSPPPPARIVVVKKGD